MPNVAPIINAFNGGEISPQLYGRTDLQKYYTSARRIENFICLPEGGLLRRSGARYVAQVKDMTERSRMIPFVFSTDQAYVLEFADRCIRIFANEATVVPIASNFAANATDVDIEADEIQIENHGFAHEQTTFGLTTSAADLPLGLATATNYKVHLAQPTTFTNANVSGNDLINMTAHGYTTGMGPFKMRTSGEYPSAGIDDEDTSYIIRVDADTIALATNEATAKLGTKIALAVGVDGTHYLDPTPTYQRDYFRLELSTGGGIVDIQDVGTGTHTITPGGALVLEIDTPYLEADLYNLQTIQSADVLYIVHEDYKARKLQRLGATTWHLDEIDFIDGPYLPRNVTETTINPSSSTGLIDIAANDPIFVPADASSQRHLRYAPDAENAGWIRITEFTDNENVKGRVISELAAASPSTAAWSLGAYSSAQGYPQAVTFFEQRLSFGGAPSSPQQFNASKSADFETFSPTTLGVEDSPVAGDTYNIVTADSSLIYVLSANQVNRVRWMNSIRSLLIGTSGGVWAVQASSLQEAITPTNINARRDTTRGSALVTPVNVSDEVSYLSQFGRELLSVGFSFEDDDYHPNDLTKFSNHILGMGVDELDYQQQPHSVIWIVRKDGVLAGCTYVREEEIFAWHRQILGGSFSTGDAVVESVAVIPSPDESHNQVWVQVKRTVNGSTVRYIEFFEDDFGVDTDLEDAFFVDSGITFTGAGTTVTGLTHLIGEDVDILIDGTTVETGLTVDGSGRVTTTEAVVAQAQVGLPYISEVETLNFEPRAGFSAQGKTQRIVKFIGRFHLTVEGKISRDGSDFDPLNFTDATLFSGDKDMLHPEGHDQEARMTVRQDQPYPMTLSCVMPEAVLAVRR